MSKASRASADRIRETLRPVLGEYDRARLSVQLPLTAGPEASQNEVRRAHVVAQARKGLESAGVAPAAIARRVERLDAALSELAVASPARQTLAAFESERGLCVLPLHRSLPYQVSVRRTLALRPALAALALEGPYAVLAVSVKRVALFEGDAGGLALAPSGAIPRSLEDALGTEKTEKQLQFRGTRAGGAAPVYYAHGAAEDERERDLRRFHHVLALAVNAHIRDDPTPLVLAADVAHQAGLREELRVPGLLEPLAVSPDAWSPAELHRRAWPLVEAARAADERGAPLALERASRVGKTAELLDDVAVAAVGGRVRRLWVAAERAEPGWIDPTTGRAHAGDPDSDVLDQLVELVLVHGGEVRVVPLEALPGGSGAAAELR